MEVWVGDGVGDGDIPCEALFSLPWNDGQLVRSFYVGARQSDRLQNGWRAYYYYVIYFLFCFIPSVLIIPMVKNIKRLLIFTCLCVKSASECDLIKPLYQNGDALKKQERLSRIVWDCRETHFQFGQEWVSSFIDRDELSQWLLAQIDEMPADRHTSRLSSQPPPALCCCDLGTDDDIGRCQRVYHSGIPGQAAVTLPWH